MPKQSHMGKMILDYKIENTWGPDSCPPTSTAGRGYWQMKHFHLSQGDKLTGLDGPLYLQKKIKSVLTLAPFIGNTCWLVIVLNSVLSRAAPPWAALEFSHWLGMAVEFAENFFPIPEAPRGDIPGLSRQKSSVGLPASWRKALAPRSERAAPLPLAPRVLIRRLERIKGTRGPN